jgi:hypothetical protein
MVAGVSFSGAALATVVIVARLKTRNAARMRYFIGILNLVGRDVRLQLKYGMPGLTDNPSFADWIYALSEEVHSSAIAAYRSASRSSAARTSADVSTLASARRSGTISMSSAAVTCDIEGLSCCLVWPPL